MVKLVFFAAVVVVCVAAGPLLADVYKCDINAGASQGNWIAARYSFDFDVNSSSVSVSDGVAEAFLGGPAAGKIVANTAKKLVFTWVIATKDSSNQQVNMQYRASLFKSTMAMTVTATPPGYSNTFQARGTCSPA